MKPTAPGYMLLLTLMIAAVAVTAVTYIARRNSVYQPTAYRAADREKALQLAFSGIEVAMSQLAGRKPEKQTEKKSPTDAKSVESPEKKMLALLLPLNGRWQTFELNEKRDGMQGTIKTCITSEDGKLNLNAVYDFKEKKFFGEKEAAEDKNYRTIVEKILTRVGSSMSAPDLFRGLEAFLKKRDKPLVDVSELLTIKEFEPFKSALFYEPAEDKKKLALADLFTVWVDAKVMNAWLLSPSIQRSMGNMQSDFMKVADETMIKKIVDSYAPNLELTQAWDKMLAPFYGIPLASLPAYAKGVLDIRFGPRVFSVLSYGIVGKTTQKLLAIITLKEDPSSESDAAYSVVMKKLYWL